METDKGTSPAALRRCAAAAEKMRNAHGSQNAWGCGHQEDKMRAKNMNVACVERIGHEMKHTARLSLVIAFL